MYLHAINPTSQISNSEQVLGIQLHPLCVYMYNSQRVLSDRRGKLGCQCCIEQDRHWVI